MDAAPQHSDQQPSLISRPPTAEGIGADTPAPPPLSALAPTDTSSTTPTTAHPTAAAAGDMISVSSLSAAPTRAAAAGGVGGQQQPPEAASLASGAALDNTTAGIDGELLLSRDASVRGTSANADNGDGRARASLPRQADDGEGATLLSLQPIGQSPELGPTSTSGAANNANNVSIGSNNNSRANLISPRPASVSFREMPEVQHNSSATNVNSILNTSSNNRANISSGPAGANTSGGGGLAGNSSNVGRYVPSASGSFHSPAFTPPPTSRPPTGGQRPPQRVPSFTGATGTGNTSSNDTHIRGSMPSSGPPTAIGGNNAATNHGGGGTYGSETTDDSTTPMLISGASSPRQGGGSAMLSPRTPQSTMRGGHNRHNKRKHKAAAAYDISIGAWQGKWSTDIAAIASVSSYAVARYFVSANRIDIVECKNLEASSADGGANSGGGANIVNSASGNDAAAEHEYLSKACTLPVHVAEVSSLNLTMCRLKQHQKLLSIHTFTIEPRNGIQHVPQNPLVYTGRKGSFIGTNVTGGGATTAATTNNSTTDGSVITAEDFLRRKSSVVLGLGTNSQGTSPARRGSTTAVGHNGDADGAEDQIAKSMLVDDNNEMDLGGTATFTSSDNESPQKPQQQNNQRNATNNSYASATSEGYFFSNPESIPYGTYLLCLLKDDPSNYIVLNVTVSNKLLMVGRGRFGQGKDFFSTMKLSDGEFHANYDPSTVKTNEFFAPTHFSVFGSPSPHYGLAYNADSGEYAVVSLISLVLTAAVQHRRQYPQAFLPPTVAPAVNAYLAEMTGTPVGMFNTSSTSGGGGIFGNSASGGLSSTSSDGPHHHHVCANAPPAAIPLAGGGTSNDAQQQGSQQQLTSTPSFCDPNASNVRTAIIVQRGRFQCDWSDVMWKGSPHRYSTRQKFFCYDAVTGACGFECLRIDRRYVMLAEGEEVSFPIVGDKAQESSDDEINTDGAPSPNEAGGNNTTTATTTANSTFGTFGNVGMANSGSNSNGGTPKMSAQDPDAEAHGNTNANNAAAAMALDARIAAHRRSVALVGTEKLPARRRGCLVIPVNLNKQVGCLLYSHNHLSVPANGRSSGVVPRIGYSRRREGGMSFDNATAMLQKRIFAHDEPWTNCVFLTNVTHNSKDPHLPDASVADPRKSDINPFTGGLKQPMSLLKSTNGPDSGNSILNRNNPSAARSFLMSYSSQSGVVWISQIYQIATGSKAGNDAALPSLGHSPTGTNISTPAMISFPGSPAYFNTRWGQPVGSGTTSNPPMLPSIAALSPHLSMHGGMVGSGGSVGGNGSGAPNLNSSLRSLRSGSAGPHQRGGTPRLVSAGAQRGGQPPLPPHHPIYGGAIGIGGLASSANNWSGLNGGSSLNNISPANASSRRPNSGKALLEEWRRSPTNTKSGRDVHLYDEVRDELGQPYAVTSRYVNTPPRGSSPSALSSSAQQQSGASGRAGVGFQGDNDSFSGGYTSTMRNIGGRMVVQGTEYAEVEEDGVDDEATDNARYGGRDGGVGAQATAPSTQQQQPQQQPTTAPSDELPATKTDDSGTEGEQAERPATAPIRVSLAALMAGGATARGFTPVTDCDDIIINSRAGSKNRMNSTASSNKRGSGLADSVTSTYAARPPLGARPKASSIQMANSARLPRPPSGGNSNPANNNGGSESARPHTAAHSTTSNRNLPPHRLSAIRGDSANSQRQPRRVYDVDPNTPSWMQDTNQSYYRQRGKPQMADGGYLSGGGGNGRGAAASGYGSDDGDADGSGTDTPRRNTAGGSNRKGGGSPAAIRGRGKEVYDQEAAERQKIYAFKVPERPKSGGKRTVPDVIDDDDYASGGGKTDGSEGEDNNKSPRFHRRIKASTPRLRKRSKSPSSGGGIGASTDEEGGSPETRRTSSKKGGGKKLPDSTNSLLSDSTTATPSKRYRGASKGMFLDSTVSSAGGASLTSYNRRKEGFPKMSDNFHDDITAIICYMRDTEQIPAIHSRAIELALEKVADMEEGDDDGGMMEKEEYKYAGVYVATPWKSTLGARSEPHQSMASSPARHSAMYKFDKMFAKKREEEIPKMIFTEKKMEQLYKPLHNREEFQAAQIKKLMAQHMKLQLATKDPHGPPDPPVNVKKVVDRLADNDLAIRKTNMETRLKKREKELKRDIKEYPTMTPPKMEEHVNKMYGEAIKIHTQNMDKLLRNRDKRERDEMVGKDRKPLSKAEENELKLRLIDKSIHRREVERESILKEMDKGVMKPSVKLGDDELAEMATRLTTNMKPYVHPQVTGTFTARSSSPN